MNKEQATRKALELALTHLTNPMALQMSRDQIVAHIKEALQSNEQVEPVAWIAFDDMEPPIDSALDDKEVKTPRSVLITNNIKAKDRMGRKSHVWFAAPMKNTNGEWVAFDEASRKIEFLTHWFDPFAAHPPVPTAQPEEVSKELLLAITNYGLTLLKTQHGYELRKLGPIVAFGIKE